MLCKQESRVNICMCFERLADSCTQLQNIACILRIRSASTISLEFDSVYNKENIA